MSLLGPAVLEGLPRLVLHHPRRLAHESGSESTRREGHRPPPPGSGTRLRIERFASGHPLFNRTVAKAQGTSGKRRVADSPLSLRERAQAVTLERPNPA